MNVLLRTLATGAATAAAAFSLAVDIYGVDGNNNLVRFDSATPGTVSTLGNINFASGDRLVGLDFRSNGGALYALGALANIYTLNKSNGSVLTTKALSFPTGGDPSLDPSARSFGVDFNPTVDRLRIVSNTGQNLRVNVDTGGVTTDIDLAYTAGDPNAAATPSIVAVAYTNNQFGGPNPQTPTRTTALFDIDSSLDILAQQTNANGGVLATRQALGVDALLSGTDADVFTSASGVNSGFLLTGSSLYSLALPTSSVAGNAATLLGAVPGGVFLIAAQPVPEPATMVAFGLGAAALLRRRRKA